MVAEELEVKAVVQELEPVLRLVVAVVQELQEEAVQSCGWWWQRSWRSRQCMVQKLEPVLRLVVAEELEAKAVHGAEAGASPAAGGGRGAGGRGSAWC